MRTKKNGIRKNRTKRRELHGGAFKNTLFPAAVPVHNSDKDISDKRKAEKKRIMDAGTAGWRPFDSTDTEGSVSSELSGSYDSISMKPAEVTEDNNLSVVNEKIKDLEKQIKENETTYSSCNIFFLILDSNFPRFCNNCCSYEKHYHKSN